MIACTGEGGQRAARSAKHRSWQGRWACVLLSGLVWILVALPGCAKATLGAPELRQTLARHYLDLRWGRIASAAQYIAAPMQAAFVAEWEARAQRMQLQDFEVTHILDHPDGEGADVYLSLSWVDQDTLTLRQAALVQAWSKTEQGWRASALLELPAP